MTNIESYYRNNLKPVKKIEYKKDIEFQITSWHAVNEDPSMDEESDESSNSKEKKDMSLVKYTIRLFGTTKSGHSIQCRISDFNPFFFIKVSPEWTDKHLKILLTFIKKKLSFQQGKDYSKCILETKCRIVKRKDIYGFNNGQLFTFIKLVFSNKDAMSKTSYQFKNKPENSGRYWSLKNIAKQEKKDSNWADIEYKETGGTFIVTEIKGTPKMKEWVLYEDRFEPYIRFSHVADINMAGWVKLPVGTFTKIIEDSNCQINVSVSWKSIESLKDNDSMAPVLQASFDIECYSFDYTFPKALLKENRVTQIATVFKYYKDTKTLLKHILVLKDCSEIRKLDDVPVIVECFPPTDDGEMRMLIRWSELIRETDPDILYTWNGDGFDSEYLINRYRLLLDNCHHTNPLEVAKFPDSLHKTCTHYTNTEFCDNLSRMGSKYSAFLKDEAFQSSAHGSNSYKRLYIPGRLNYDLHIHVKRGMVKYPSYKLNYIAGEILKDKKNDVTPKQIFQFYEGGDPDKIRDVAEYCIQDSELLQRLVDKMQILVNICQMSNVTNVPIEFLTTRGQSVKVFSQIFKKAREMGFLVPNLDTSNTEQFEGATVLPPQVGSYFNEIAVLDFASLYPCEIIAHNLCYSTFLTKSKDNNFEYDNIEGIEYDTYKWSGTVDDETFLRAGNTCEKIMATGKRQNEICGKPAFFEENAVFYCRTHDPKKKERSEDEKAKKLIIDYDYKVVNNIKGVLPCLLEELYEKRKSVKRLMAIELKKAEGFQKIEDLQSFNEAIFLASVYDQAQLAIKVSLNSVYGVLGANHGFVIKALAAIVTYIGRSMIKQSKDYSETTFIEFVRDNELLTDTVKTKKLEMSKEEKQQYLKDREN